MLFLTAAVVLVGALGLLNLLLAAAILRRLREHEEQLSTAARSMPGPEDLIGLPIPEISARSLDGRPLERAALASAPALLGFFAAACSSCHDEAPKFARLAVDVGVAIAVIDGDGKGRDDLVRQLRDVAMIVVDAEAARIASSLDVRNYPTFLRTDGTGHIIAGSRQVEHLTLEPVA